MLPSYPLAFFGALLSFGPCLAQELFVPTNPDVSFGKLSLFEPNDQILMKNGLSAYGNSSQSLAVPGQVIAIGPGLGDVPLVFVNPGLDHWSQRAADTDLGAMLGVIPQYYEGLNGALSWDEAAGDFQFDLGQMTAIERAEYQDLVSRYEELSPLELKRLDELNKKGITVVGGTPPKLPKEPVIVIVPLKSLRKCANGIELPKWCEYLQNKSEFCKCPGD